MDLFHCTYGTLCILLSAFEKEKSGANDWVFYWCGQGVFQHWKLQLPDGNHCWYQHEPRVSAKEDGKCLLPFFIFVYFLFSSGMKKSKKLQILLYQSTIHLKKTQKICIWQKEGQCTINDCIGRNILTKISNMTNKNGQCTISNYIVKINSKNTVLLMIVL